MADQLLLLTKMGNLTKMRKETTVAMYYTMSWRKLELR